MSSRAKTAGDLAIYSAGTIIRQITGFIMLPIYTTYLTPADYGVVGLLSVMVGVFELLFGARFMSAVPKYYHDAADASAKSAVVTTALFLTVGVSVVFTGLIALNSQFVSSIVFGSIDYEHHVAVYCILLFTSAIEYYGLTFVRLQERALLFFANSIAKLVLQLSLNIYFVVVQEMGAMGVVLSAATSSSVFAAMLAAYTLWYTGFRFSPALSVRLFRFSWPLWLGGLAALYTASSNRYFLRVLADLDQVGLFELASRFAAILTALVWDPFMQWWQIERFKLYQRSDRGRAVYPVVFNGIVAFKVLVATGICLFSGPVIQIMSAEPFHRAEQAVPIIVYAVLVFQLASFFFFSFYAVERTLMVTYIRYSAAAVMTVLYFVLIPPFGFVGAAFSLLITNSMVFYVTYILSKRSFDSNIRLGYFGALMALSLVVSAVGYVVAQNVSSLFAEISIKTVLASIMFCIILVSVRRNKDLNELFESGLSWVIMKVVR